LLNTEYCILSPEMYASTDPFLIVGAGLSGLVAARWLNALGYETIVLEQAPDVGGRMATRTFGDARFDSGAQFFTVRDPQFRRMVNQWLAAGVVTEWSRGFTSPSGHARQDGHARYRGVPGMDGVPRYLAEGLDVRLNQTVTSAALNGRYWQLTLEGGETIDGRALLLTPPLPQSLAILSAGGFCLPQDQQDLLVAVEYAQCLALLVELEEPSRLPSPGGIQLHGEPITFIGDNSQKGVSPGACTATIHAGPNFSETHWDSPDEEIAALLLDEASYWIGAAVRGWRLDRWRYSMPKEIVPQRLLHLPGPPQLALAGDVFGGPRVEGAALSGLAAAEQLLNGV